MILLVCFLIFLYGVSCLLYISLVVLAYLYEMSTSGYKGPHIASLEDVGAIIVIASALCTPILGTITLLILAGPALKRIIYDK